MDVPGSKKERTGCIAMHIVEIGQESNKTTLILRLPKATLLHLENALAYHVFIFCSSLIVQKISEKNKRVSIKSPSMIRTHENHTLVDIMDVLVSRDISGIF